MIEGVGLNDMFPYLDNITVAGKYKRDHNRNIQRFLEVIGLSNLSLNQSKTVESANQSTLWDIVLVMVFLNPI